MSTFKTKKQKDFEQEIVYAEQNPRLDEDLPAATIFPPTQLVALCYPKKMKSPYLEMVLLFACAIISIGADAFIFSSSLFGTLMAKLDMGLTTAISVFCIIAHLVPEIFWGINIYKKGARLSGYTIILTTDKIIACGKAGNTLVTTINLEDLLEVKQKGSTVTIVAVAQKLKVDFLNPTPFADLVKDLYNNL